MTRYVVIVDLDRVRWIDLRGDDNYNCSKRIEKGLLELNVTSHTQYWENLEVNNNRRNILFSSNSSDDH